VNGYRILKLLTSRVSDPNTDLIRSVDPDPGGQKLPTKIFMF
jgi:hypothetical protein